MKRSLLVLFVLTAAFLLVFSGCAKKEEAGEMAAASSVDYTDNPWTDGQDLSGTEVNVFGAFVDEDANRLNKSMIPFEEATGIDIVYEGSGDFETLVTVRAEGGDPPDIAVFPQPGLAHDMVKGGYVYDVGEWLGMDYLRGQYSDAWIDLANMEGIEAGVFYRANVKSLVWYNMPTFEKEGYEIPQTWDDMMALSDQMVADGYTPWAIGIESSGATGWVATDWVEDVMLRIHPPEVYDQWVAGEVKFDSPEVKEALDYISAIWFNDDYVLGGREGIVLTPFGDAITPITGENPAALMHRQANFIMGFMPEKGAEVGKTVGFFYLPPIKPELGRPVLGAGDLYSPMQDRPEVRAAMKFISQGISAKGWIEEGGFASPHKDADLAWYPSEADRGVADILQQATTFRFDGSDLMPGAVGAGTFWTQMTRWVNEPDADLDSLLDAIDASYPR